jgi:hypothetical protein
MQISTRSEDFVVDALALRTDIGAAVLQQTVAETRLCLFPPAKPARDALC